MLIDAIRDQIAQNQNTTFKDALGNTVDRKLTLTASEAGTCLRRVKFTKTDAVKDNDHDDPGGLFARGHNVEDWAVRTLAEAGIEVQFAGEDQHSIVVEGRGLSGTPDGYLPGTRQTLEIKSVDPRTNFEKSLPRKAHVRQLEINMHLQRSEGLEVDSGRLLYVSASDYSVMVEYEVPFNDDAWGWAAQRSNELFTSEANEIYPEGADDGRACSYCPFKTVCGDAKMPTQRHSPGEFSEAAKLLSAAFTSQSQIKDLQVAEKAQKNAVRQYMISHKITELADSGITAQLAETPGRDSLDKVAVGEAGIDLSPFTKTGKPGSRLTITQKA